MPLKPMLTALPFLLALSAVASAEPDAVDDAQTAPYIRSALPLDEPRHLCIDVPGHGDASDPDQDLTVHTCKDGMWNLDQRFRWSADGAQLKMPQYGKCLAVEEVKTGEALVLANCDSENTKWTADHARLKLASDTSFCITIAEGRSELTPGGKRFPQKYRARSVSLEKCTDSALERQLWSIIQPLDLEAPLLPPGGSLQDD